MDLMENMDKGRIRNFFSKGWLTHDAMWYYHSLQELGHEKANKINLAAVKSMSGVEIGRILKLMGKQQQPVKTFEELKEIMGTAFELIKPEFMKLHYDFPEKNILTGGFNECFAYEGVKKFGMIDIYQCGIIVRIQGWLEALGVEYTMEPEINGCLMHKNGKCEITFKFNLD